MGFGKGEVGRVSVMGQMGFRECRLDFVEFDICIYILVHLYFYLINRYDFGKIFNYKVVKNVIIDEHVKFQRIRSLFNILFNFMEFMS